MKKKTYLDKSRATIQSQMHVHDGSVLFQNVSQVVFRRFLVNVRDKDDPALK
jgi:hypothetical protein